MAKYSSLTKNELVTELEAVKKEFEEIKGDDDLPF